LAKILGIARPSLSNIERGINNPRYSLVVKIAKYFGKPVEHIFFEDCVLQEVRKIEGE
jgi:DNA-binding XRE family transcriptional regulator